MSDVYIVSVGIGWNGQQNDVVVFRTLKGAREYVTEQLENDIETLKEYYNLENITFDLKIGNTYEIKRVRMETTKKKGVLP